MKYFIDTEFIEGFHKPMFGKDRHFIDLISIGIVCEDGREYYAISEEYNYNDASDWVKNNVILPMYRQQCSGFKEQYMDIKTFHKFTSYSKSKADIAFDIFRFIHQPVIKKWDDRISFAEEIVQSAYEQGEPIHEFYGYYSDYDWVLFCSLFGTMIDLPRGFPMYCKDIKQMMDDKGLTSEWKQRECPDPIGEHNALVDARWNMKLHDLIHKL